MQDGDCILWIKNHTIKFYRDAVNYLVGIALSHYPELKEIHDSEKATAGQLRRQYVEWLVHSTKGNEAAYPYFDQHFYKMPSYLRRDAITTAIGKVFAYRKWVENWEKRILSMQLPACQTGRQKPRYWQNGIADMSLGLHM